LFVCVAGPGSRLYTAAEEEPETFDYYIGPSGSDSNPGTEAEPWAITALNTKRATYGGTRVGLLNGTYSVAGMSEETASMRINLVSGSSGSPTVIQAVNARQAIIDGGNDSDLASMGISETAAGYLEIRNLVFQNSRKHSMLLYSTSTQGVGLIVEGCEFRNQTFTTDTDYSPILLAQGWDDPIFRNCRFHDLTSTESGTSPAGIEMYACRDAVIEYCSFYDIDGWGYYDKYAANGIEMQGTIVRYCYFKNCTVALGGFDNTQQTNVLPDEGPYTAYQIYNNVFQDCPSILSNAGAFSADAPMLCWNNTVYRSTGTLSGFNLHCVTQPGRDPSFYNNIVYNAGTWFDWRAVTISLDGSTPAIDVVDYNCYGPSAMACQYQDVIGYPYREGASYEVVTSISTWRTTTGQEAGSIVDDPEFVMTGTEADQFKLGGSSPCLNAGRVGGLSAGATRHMGAWDGVVTQIGADFAEAA
jgi:hypothetical protein